MRKEQLLDSLKQAVGEPSSGFVEAKDYEKLLDDHSLHKFIIRKGRVLSETPEFKSFRRTCNEVWSSLDPLIRRLEAMLGRAGVTATVQGKFLLELVAKGKKVTDGNLLLALEDLERLQHRLRWVGLRPELTPSLAAIRLQSYYRMHRVRQQYAQIK
jgi:IQ domain-containing protein H